MKVEIIAQAILAIFFVISIVAAGDEMVTRKNWSNFAFISTITLFVYLSGGFSFLLPSVF